jgi:hypothetical protein
VPGFSSILSATAGCGSMLPAPGVNTSSPEPADGGVASFPAAGIVPDAGSGALAPADAIPVPIASATITPSCTGHPGRPEGPTPPCLARATFWTIPDRSRPAALKVVEVLPRHEGHVIRDLWLLSALVAMVAGFLVANR